MYSLHDLTFIHLTFVLCKIIECDLMYHLHSIKSTYLFSYIIYIYCFFYIYECTLYVIIAK